MVRVRIVLASWLALFLVAVPSFAADPSPETTSAQTSTARATNVSPFATALTSAPTVELNSAPAVVQNDWYKNSRRPSILPALYLGSAALQAFDAYSTMSALKSGGTEANPLMKSAASNPVALIGIKATVTVASIMAAERMWRGHNRIGAIAVMAASNGMMAIVAAHNASVLTTLR